MEPRIETHLLMLEQGWGPKAWHGTALKGAIRGVTATQALWRPAPGRHNIWELVLHMAYWKYAIIRRLEGAPTGGFPRNGSNWIAVTDPSEKAWRADVKLLHDLHRQLANLVRRFPASRLKRSTGRAWTWAQEIAGIAAHDLYHTGQLQLLKKLMASTRRS